MKKLFLLLAVSLVCSISYSRGKSGFAAGAGYALMSLKESAGGGLSQTMNFNGVQAGADYTFSELMGPVSLTPGIRYFYGKNNADKTSETVHDIQIPVDFSWGAELGPVYVFLYAGPSFAFNVEWAQSAGGKVTSFYSTENGGGSNRFDVKLGGGAGVVFNGAVRLTTGYRAGLLNVCKGDFAKYCTIRRSQFTVSLAYCF